MADIQLSAIRPGPTETSAGVRKDPAVETEGAFAALLAMMLVQPAAGQGLPGSPAEPAEAAEAAEAEITVAASSLNPGSPAQSPAGGWPGVAPDSVANGLQVTAEVHKVPLTSPDATVAARIMPDLRETAVGERLGDMSATKAEAAVQAVSSEGPGDAEARLTVSTAAPAAPLLDMLTAKPEAKASAGSVTTEPDTLTTVLFGDSTATQSAAHLPEGGVPPIEPGPAAQPVPARKTKQGEAPERSADSDWIGQAAPAAAGATAAPSLPEEPHGLSPGGRVDVDRVMAEVARTVRTSPDGVHSLTLHLHPEHLGEVKLHMNLVGKDVQTVFEVGTSEAGQALELRGDQLRSELAEAGLSLSGFTVSTGLGARSQPGRDAEVNRPAGQQRRGKGSAALGRLETVGRLAGPQPRPGGIDFMA